MGEHINLANRSDIHLKRRLWHLLCGVGFLLVYYFTNIELRYFGFLSVAIAFFGFILDFRRFKDPVLNEKLSRAFGHIMRSSEKMGFSGLPFYALGVALAIFLYREEIAVISILYLVFADPIASVIGVHYGKDRLLPNKTLQGTVAAFATCLIVGVSYLIMSEINSANIIIFAFFGAIIGALSEMLGAFNIDDNLIIPVLSGAALTGLNSWLLIF